MRVISARRHRILWCFRGNKRKFFAICVSSKYNAIINSSNWCRLQYTNITVILIFLIFHFNFAWFFLLYKMSVLKFVQVKLVWNCFENKFHIIRTCIKSLALCPRFQFWLYFKSFNWNHLIQLFFFRKKFFFPRLFYCCLLKEI